jgi:hypothetical protein
MKFTVIILVLLWSSNVCGQCCGGGSGSPIAGGTSQGVLQEKQLEININYQNINTSKFLDGNSIASNYLQHYYSQYIYSRVAYGITKNFTMSVESGYYLNKTQYGLHYNDTISSHGISDLIIFPRYDILNKSEDGKTIEITIGLGIKLPVGLSNDSMVLFHNPTTGEYIYDKKPPIVQPTNGSQDIIFYGFIFRGYPLKKFRIFSNMLYIRKGWNSQGEKFGDFASIGLFASKTVLERLGITLQLKGEWMDKMQRMSNLPFPNYDPNATGSKKIFIVPQLSYSFFHDRLSAYVLSEFPLYQYVNNTQVASQFSTTFGLSYRFYSYGDK